MKKNVLIGLNVFLVLLIGVASYFLFREWKERQVVDFIAEQKEVLKPKTAHLIQEGNIGGHQVIAFIPTDQEGKAIEPVQAAVERLVKREIGSAKPTGTITDISFVTLTEIPTSYRSVRQSTLSLQQYAMGILTVEAKDTKQGEILLLTDKQELFGFSSLFKNQEKTKSIIAKQLKTDLESKQISGEKLAAFEAAFQANAVDQLPFTYQNSQIVFQLEEVKMGVAQVTLPVEQLYEVIQATYLSDVDAKAYEEYKAKKANEKMIALTFDDGPSPATTPQILDTLKRYNAKATFFILGQNIPGNEEILKRIVAEGHELANHTWTHPDMATLSPEEIKQEVQQTQDKIKEVTGQTPLVMRPPYGSFNQTVMDTMGLPAIHWSVDTLDWQSRDPQAILGVVQVTTYPGSIILMHDIHQPTADSLPAVMEFLTGQGYTFGTISEMLPEPLNPKHVYYDRNRNEPAQ